MVKVLILGLLDKCSMHGYGIQEEIKKGSYQIWADINPNSIYSALRTLEKNGFVCLNESVYKGRQLKSVYCITEAGKMEHRRLLKQTIAAKKLCFPSDLYMGLSFLADLNREDAAEAVARRIEFIQHQIEYWAVGKQKKVPKEQEDTLLDHLFINGITHLKADCDFLLFVQHNLDQVMTDLKKKLEDYLGKKS